MGKPSGFTCSLSCLALKAFSLFDCKLLMIKPHLTSIDLSHQFSIYTTSQSIVVGLLLSFTGSSSFKGLILYLKIPSNDLRKYRRPTFSQRVCVSTVMMICGWTPVMSQHRPENDRKRKCICQKMHEKMRVVIFWLAF